MELRGRGRRGRRPELRVAAEERVQEGTRERGEGRKLNTHTGRGEEKEREKASRQAGSGSSRTHTPAGKANTSVKPEPGREGCGAGWPRAVPRRWGSWGKPGRTGDHPKSNGGEGGIRLPASPLAPPSPPSSSKLPSPLLPGAAARPRGTAAAAAPRGAGGQRGLGPGRGELRRPAAALAPGRAGEQRAEFGGRGSGRQGRRSRRSWARGKRRAAGPRGFPRGLLAPANPGVPLPPPAALRALPAATGSERERNVGLLAAGRRGQRAGNGGGRERGGSEAAGGTEKWLELGGCGGSGCNFAERTRSEADAAGTGRDQVAVEISSGGERVCGAKYGCGGECEGLTVPGTAADSGEERRARARRGEELPAAVRDTSPGRAAAGRGSEGAAGAGVRRRPVGGRARARTGGAVRGRGRAAPPWDVFSFPPAAPRLRPSPLSPPLPPWLPLPSFIHRHGDALRGCRARVRERMRDVAEGPNRR
nr:collagen alpha-1(I) chain-like [Taeniopygia guttata]